MTFMNAKITVNKLGTGLLHLNDVDLSKAVRGFTLTAEAGQIPKLTLDLLAWASVDAEVALHPATHELLVDLGWTPPGGDAA